MLKPSGVIEKVREKTNSNISLNIHSYLWKIFGVRPGKNSEEKFSTNDRYCVYDEPHDDYLYTYEWVEFISNLYLKYGFNNDKIKSLKDSSLKTEDYK